MANLSQDDRAVIAEHPLDDSLDQSTSDNGADDTRDQGPLKAVSRLLYTLQGHEVALTLRSKTGTGDLASELSTLFKRVRNGYLNDFRPKPMAGPWKSVRCRSGDAARLGATSVCRCVLKSRDSMSGTLRR